MSPPALQATHVCKKFCRDLRRSLWYGTVDAARAMAGLGAPPPRLRAGEFWALDDISLELHAGEAVGIIGRNGSGKTTLLRILNGIFPPTAGDVRFRGQMGALIAVGAGFHPHMTGRENIFLNAALLGLDRQAVRRRFDEIVAFADVGAFLDAPVSTYSSGMAVRLGFSIAVHATPEILLADEILAVGDLGFALKCYRKIAAYRREGGSLLLVSHSMQLVRNVCDRVYWIDGGRVRQTGPAGEVCTAFENELSRQDLDQPATGEGVRHALDPAARIESVTFHGPGGEPVTTLTSGEPLTIRLDVRCERRVERPVFTVGISSMDTVGIVSLYSSRDGVGAPPLHGTHRVEVRIPSLPLKPGAYLCTTTFAEGSLENILDWHEKAHRFTILGRGGLQHGIFQPLESWHIEPAAPETRP